MPASPSWRICLRTVQSLLCSSDSERNSALTVPIPWGPKWRLLRMQSFPIWILSVGQVLCVCPNFAHLPTCGYRFRWWVALGSTQDFPCGRFPAWIRHEAAASADPQLFIACLLPGERPDSVTRAWWLSRFFCCIWVSLPMGLMHRSSSSSPACRYRCACR